MANPYQPLDLAALAAQAQAETGTRVAGGQGHLEASLASMLQEQQGGLAGNAEAQGREQTFQRSQAMLAEALARREQALEAASAMARARAAGGGDDGLSWLDKQEILWAREDAKADAAAKAAKEADTYRVSDFGRDEVSATRGRVLLQERPGKYFTRAQKAAALDKYWKAESTAPGSGGRAVEAYFATEYGPKAAKDGRPGPRWLDPIYRKQQPLERMRPGGKHPSTRGGYVDPKAAQRASVLLSQFLGPD